MFGLRGLVEGWSDSGDGIIEQTQQHHEKNGMSITSPVPRATGNTSLFSSTASDALGPSECAGNLRCSGCDQRFRCFSLPGPPTYLPVARPGISQMKESMRSRSSTAHGQPPTVFWRLQLGLREIWGQLRQRRADATQTPRQGPIRE